MSYDVRTYGAVGNGKTVDTKAIQEAIDDCHAHGGGTVVFAGGTYLAGTLYLKSNVTLELEVSATLLLNPDIDDYGTDTHYNRYQNETDMDRCFLFAQDAENIGIRGQGRIEGNAAAFPNKGSIYRPMMIRFLRCSHVRLEGVKLMDSPAWTCAFLDSSFIWVREVYIENHRQYNGDGLDFDGCSHVYVTGCHMDGTDDNLCLQSSSKDYPCQDIHISDCSFTSICAGIRIGLKSVGDIRNVAIANCTMHNVWREGIKVECSEGGTITDIVAQGITMRNVRRPIFVILNNRWDANGLGGTVGLKQVPPIGEMARLMFSNMVFIDDREMKNTHKRFENDIMGEPRFGGIRIDAQKDHPICDITLSNISYTFIGGVKAEDIPAQYPQVLDMRYHQGETTSENYTPNWSRTVFMDARNVDGLTLNGLNFETIEPDGRPAVLTDGCRLNPTSK